MFHGTTRRTPLRLCALALILVALLAACGGDAVPGEDAATAAPAPGSPATDREILVTLYNELDGPNWRTNENWLSDMPVGEWYGVTTDDNGRVTRLQLNINRLTGNIPPALGDLASLEGLEIVSNQLTGSVPPELGNLSRLLTFELDDNQLSGEIPSELGNFDHLATLSLSDN